MLLYALYFYVRTIPASASILRARIVAVTATVLFSCPLAFLFFSFNCFLSIVASLSSHTLRVRAGEAENGANPA